MEEENLKCLCVVFGHFWEHNLMLKLIKCEFFWDEINYSAHHISKEGLLDLLWGEDKRIQVMEVSTLVVLVP